MEYEAEDVSVTVTGFGAAPNCHFRLLNVHEHSASYDGAGLDRYTSPGAGGSTPWFNRTSTAAWDIQAGSELFVGTFGIGIQFSTFLTVLSHLLRFACSIRLWSELVPLKRWCFQFSANRREL